MLNIKSLVAIGAVALSSAAFAEDASWTLDPANSSVSFGSIKNDAVGESHNFHGLSGTVSDDGKVALEIDLGSVETKVDIRNERMAEFVFKNAPTATLTAEVEMETLNKLEVGGSTTTDVFGTLSLLGTDVDVDAVLFVMRVSEDKVMVTTDGMAMLNVNDAGITAGIDKLQEIAGLDSITRVSPLTARLFFSTKGDGES